MTTRLVDNRQAALEAGYNATDWSRPVPYEEYLTCMDTWDVKAIERDGTVIGAAFFGGPEVHVSVLPEWRKRWATKGLLKELFANEKVVTRVAPGHEYMYDILTRLGFVENDNGVFVKGH